jgi:CheY-like chemotaxis protein
LGRRWRKGSYQSGRPVFSIASIHAKSNELFETLSWRNRPIALQRITNADDKSLILILFDINMPGMSNIGHKLT